MTKILIISLLAITLLQSNNLYSQYNNITFQQISYAEGLPHSIVNDIYQDKKGFIWLATGNGLCRYDGYDFKTFQNDINDPLSIPENNIICIVPDSSGEILNLLSIASLIQYNVLAETFKAYPTQQRHLYSQLSVDNDNNLWVIANNHSVDKRIIYHDSLSSPTSIHINEEPYNIFQDSKGTLWLGTSEGLFFINTNSYEVYRYPSDDPSLEASIYAFYEDADSALWIGTNKGLVKLGDTIEAYAYNHFDELNIKNSSVSCIVEDHNNRLWIGTLQHGIYIYDKNDKQFIAHYTQDDNSNLSNNEISEIFIDKFNNIWIATINGGLNKVSLNKKAFRTYQMSNHHEVVMSLFEDSEENIWVGTVNNGLYMFNQNTNLKKHYTHNITAPNNIKGSNIASITEDDNRNIWAVSWNGYLNKINLKTNTIKGYKGGGNCLNGWAFRAISEYENNIFLGALGSGLELFDPITEKSKLIDLQIDVPSITSLYHNNNTLWIGTTQNAIEYNLFDGTSRSLLSNDSANKQTHLSMAFSEVINNTIWIGTEGGGLKSIDLTTYKVKTYTKTDGLPDNNIYGVHHDNDGNLWMSTNNGISRLDIKTSTFTNYTTSDGIQSNEFKWGAHHKCKNGDIMFGGINGFTIFTPSSIKNNKYPPKIVITNFKLFNKSIHAGDTINSRVLIDKSILYIDTLLLDYNENDIAFGFASLHYSNPKKNRFRYMLKGYDKYWIEASSDNRVAHYTNLAPGEYTFMVKSSNSDNVWSINNESVFIKIYPPWWGTLLFKIIFIFMVLFGLYSAYKIRISAIKKINTTLEKNVKERTIELKKVNATKDKFFSIIAHDLKNPFHAISSLSELLKEQFPSISDMEKIEYIDLIHQSSTGASSLLENLLQWANTQSDKIDFSPVQFDIYDIANSCIMLMQVNAKNKQIDVQNNVPENSMVFADKQMITTTIRNLLSNAIKFTPNGGAIKIDTRENRLGLEIRIEDDGVGMSEEVISKLFRIDKSQSSDGTSGEKGTGLGLLLCYEFVEKNSGSIRVESEKSKGSTFIISLPLAADK